MFETLGTMALYKVLTQISVLNNGQMPRGFDGWGGERKRRRGVKLPLSETK